MENKYRDENGRFIEGNPGGPGRKNLSVVAIIKRKLSEHTDGDPRERAEKMVDAMLDDIESRRDWRLFRLLIEHIDGKAVQKVAVSNEKEDDWIEIFKEVKRQSDDPNCPVTDDLYLRHVEDEKEA